MDGIKESPVAAGLKKEISVLDGADIQRKTLHRNQSSRAARRRSCCSRGRGYQQTWAPDVQTKVEITPCQQMVWDSAVTMSG